MSRPPSPKPLLLLGAIACLTALLPACPNGGERSTSTPPEKARGPRETGVVIFEPPGRTLRVQVEVVRRPEDLAQGLMFRKELAPMAGMLFIFPDRQEQSFWMKNTYIPLDMIFVDDRTMKVVGVIESAEPLTLTSRRVDAPSRYVVEVNAGFCKTHGIGTGTPMRVESIKL